MSEPTLIGRLSLRSRILGAVLVLAAILYVATLLSVGAALRDSARQALTAEAARELAALSSALQDSVLLRDVTAIDQVLQQRVESPLILNTAFSDGRIHLLHHDDPRPSNYPAWFGAVSQLKDVAATGELILGGVRYGELDVTLSAAAEIEALWKLALRYNLIVGLGLLLLTGILHGVLVANLRGLHALQRAAGAFSRSDYTARVEMTGVSPPEVRDTKVAFNHMASHLDGLMAELADERGKLLHEKERLRVTIESIGDGVVVTDAEGRIEFINPAAESLLAQSNAVVVGHPVSEVMKMFNEESQAEVTSPIEIALRRNVVVALDNHTELMRRDGVQIAIRDTAAPIRDPAGKVIGGILVFQDESERRHLIQRLAWQAERDHLTGLYNRRSIEQRLEAALHTVRTEQRKFVFCYIDLDRFKLVNDTCGHRAGDALLQRLTAIMARRLELSSHYLGRLGGDEFCILFQDLSLPDVISEVQAFRDEISRFHFEWEGKHFQVGVSFGITELHGEMTDIGEILAQADTACYHAKDLGGNSIQVYEHTHPALRKITDEMQWVVEISRAFESNRFLLYRQEKVALVQGNPIRYYEVLIRLRGEDGSLITPGAFIPAAERYGLAASFDRWVIRNLFAYLDTHPDDHASYAVNLSGRSVGEGSLAGFILDELAMHNFDPARISFEITETAAIDSLDECEKLILALKSRGMHFALDDFGKGQSSFGYLKRLPVDMLKIDGDFVRGVDTDREKQAIVKAMNTLAHELGITTVAEQVETEAELARIRHIGVDFAQGYWLHRPEPVLATTSN